MKYGILVRRLLLREDRYVTGGELKALCGSLGIRYEDALAYLFNRKYLERIVRGFFYVPSVEHRRLKTGLPSPFEAIAKAMEYKKVKNWYFGLETAVKLNNATHEFFTVDYVVSDSIFRAKPFLILGRKTKFVKLSKKLFGFGVKENRSFPPYSSVEKTLLDLIHLRFRCGAADKAIADELAEWAEGANEKKLFEYAKHYSAKVRKIAGELK